MTPLSSDRLSDRVSVGVLTQVFPAEVVDAVVALTGRVERRRRALPARLVVYYVLGLGLWPEASYEEVMRRLTEGLSWASSWRESWRLPSKAGIFRARQRLGFEPLAALFDGACAPLATEATRGAFYRGLRLVSLDGTCLDVADTAANEEAFGRPGSHRRAGGGAYPQLRLVGLCEVGTHALVRAVVGPCRESERALATPVIATLEAGMVCLADRGFYGFERFRAAMQTGAELVWRVPERAHLPREQVLADGSYLSTHRPARRAGHGRHLGLRVRVIEYRLHPRGGSAPSSPADDARQSYRLITTLLDPERAPAGELAQLYRERWEIERTFDELKTHQRGANVVLRSKTPSGVQQEAYGLLLTHYAIRSVMHEAALQADLDPDRLSFLRSLRATRRSARQPAGFSPHDPE